MTINFFGNPTNIELVESRYSYNDRIAIHAVCDDGPFGFLTVNIPEADLAEDEICIKTWSENSSWVPQVLDALKSTLIPTGRSIPTGFVSAPVYRVVR